MGRDWKARNLFQPKVTPTPFVVCKVSYLVSDLNNASFSEKASFWHLSIKIKPSAVEFSKVESHLEGRMLPRSESYHAPVLGCYSLLWLCRVFLVGFLSLSMYQLAQ